MLGKPSLKRQITTPKFNLFLAVGFPTHPTYSYLEELVFKKKKEKVWTKNNNQLFFEVQPSISFSSKVLCLFSCLIFKAPRPSDQSSSLSQKNGVD